jgi:hypothetical protein
MAATKTRAKAPGRMYRMPWSASDNAMTWLEPTRKCNIVCDACFTTNDPASDKPLVRIEEEIAALKGMRRSDGMFIAGGEPLTHPDIVEIVRLVRAAGYKPVLVTNGVGLTNALLAELKAAGCHGFTFHVDSHQSRPGWKGKTEEELNALRQDFADRVRAAGGMVCGFNVTVFPDALPDMRKVVAWALRNIDRVQSYSMTAVRQVNPAMPFDAYVYGRKLDLGDTAYSSPDLVANLMNDDMFAEVREVLPGFRQTAFLGGTVRPDAKKLAMGSLIGTKKQVFGQLGPKSMELMQSAHHFLRGTYLAFPRPRLNRQGRSAFLLALFDPDVRRALRAYLKAVARNPLTLFRRVYIQSINVEQAFDVLPNGEQDHCDGCPNKSLWNGQLVSACLLDEYRRWGGPAYLVPKAEPGATP